jgi:hypothetical protein
MSDTVDTSLTVVEPDKISTDDKRSSRNGKKQTSQTRNLHKLLFFCVKFDPNQIEGLISLISQSGFPENAVFKTTTGEFHITLWFCAKASDDLIKSFLADGMNNLLGKEVDVRVVSLSRNDGFGRLDVEIPSELLPFYKNEANGHITLVHTGRAVDAGTFEPTQIFPLDAIIRGKVMVSVQGNKIVDSLNF